MKKKTSPKTPKQLLSFAQTNNDLKNSVLLVSLLLNLIVLTTWLVVKIDHGYVNQLNWLIK
ncbi:MAG: hypothetical protein WBB39_02800 [Candidatus Saccharimonadales bacterium]